MMKSGDSTMAEEYPSSRFTCNLPGDIMLELVYRLPMGTLMRFKCLNKSWNSLFKNQIFINSHYDHWHKLQEWGSLVLGHNTESEIGFLKPREPIVFELTGIRELDSPKVVGVSKIGKLRPQRGPILWEPIGVHESDSLETVGVSRGLICLTPDNDLRRCCDFLVVNPALRESKIIHRELICKSKREKSEFFLTAGFGFDEKDADFKIVRVERLKNSEVRINIYSLYSDSWRQIKCFVNFMTLSRRGVLFGNSMYWSSDYDKEITVFSLSSDRFYTFPLPSRSEHCWRIQSWEDDSISVIIHEPMGGKYWRWITTPPDDPEIPCIWRRDSLFDVEKLYKRHKTLTKTLCDIFPGYKNLLDIWHYKESLVPVKRIDHCCLNVIPRLKSSFLIGYIDEVLDDPTTNDEEEISLKYTKAIERYHFRSFLGGF